MVLKRLINKLIFPTTYSSDVYINYLKSKGCKIGENTFFYSPKHTVIDTSRPEFIEIGDNCHITRGVTILAHDYSYAILRKIYNEITPTSALTKIGNNVFIGMNVTILMGTIIEDNVIIGAGSVVTGRIKSGSIVGGNPATEISTVDKYYKKLKYNTLENAKFHARHIIKTKKRNPTIKEMKHYSWLFLEKSEENLNKHFKELTFRGDNKELALANYMQLENIYESYEDFLKDL